MNEGKTKQSLSIINDINKNIDLFNNNIIFSPPNQKNKDKDEKKLYTNSNNGTSEFSQKIKSDGEKLTPEIENNEKEKYIINMDKDVLLDNNSNILLDKDKLYEIFLLFQNFLSKTHNSNKDKDNKNINNNAKDPLFSALNYFNDIISNKENENNNKDNNNKNNYKNKIISSENNKNEETKEIKPFTLTVEKKTHQISRISNSKFPKYYKNSIINDKNSSNENIIFINKIHLNDSKFNNKSNNISQKELYKKLPINSKIKKISHLFPSSSNLKNISKDVIIKELKDIDFSKINHNTQISNDSFKKNKKDKYNNYSFDFSNNNIDSYPESLRDSIKIITNDLCKNKNTKVDKIFINTDSNKFSQNHYQSSKSNDINKIINYMNNDKIHSAREITRNKNKDTFLRSYNNKEEKLMENIKKIKIIKSKRENNKEGKFYKNIDININNINYKNNNKEQIIEEKIKELNLETFKFREERDKIYKLRTEYEKLHEKLLKDINNFNEKKEKFEKYRLEEINKLKEEKKNIELKSKIFNDIKMENQSLNVSNKNDKEIINNLKNYINYLKSIIKKKDEEIKLLSQNNNNKNNYIINPFKTINSFKDENKLRHSNNNISPKMRIFRNSLLFNTSSKERFDNSYNTNLSCSKIKMNKTSNNRVKTKKYIKISNGTNNNTNLVNKSNSEVNIKNVSKKDIRKIERNIQTQNNEESNINNSRLNSFSKNVVYTQIKINNSNINNINNNNKTSINSKNLKIELDLLPKKIIEAKEKKIKKIYYKKVNGNNIRRNSKMKNIEDRKNIKNTNTYSNIKLSQEFSKTSSNFIKSKKIIKKENNKNNYNESKLLDDFKPKKRSLSNEKLKLNEDFENELNKPLNKKEYDFYIPEKYNKLNYDLIKKTKIKDKEISIYTNNKKEIIFPSGLKKEIYNDGFQLVYFNNGDIKQSFPDGKVVYFFKDENTVQTTYPNGIQVFKFYNGQIEKHFPNGFKKIFFPNGTINLLFDEKKEYETFGKGKEEEKKLNYKKPKQIEI